MPTCEKRITLFNVQILFFCKGFLKESYHRLMRVKGSSCDEVRNNLEQNIRLFFKERRKKNPGQKFCLFCSVEEAIRSIGSEDQFSLGGQIKAYNLPKENYFTRGG